MATLKRSAQSVRRDADPQKFASELLDQQLFCWGKDIEYPGGNLLMNYGLERTPAPAKSTAASLYRIAPSPTSRIVLRGFGLFIGDDRWGGVFIRRGTFRPQLTRFADLSRPAWLAEDLPRLRKLKTADHDNVQRLLVALTCWIRDYEFWIVANLGLTYRRRSLSPWKKLRNHIIPASDIAPSWQTVMNWIERDELTFCE